MKVIFLDIDGVLHSQRHEKWLSRKGCTWYDSDGAIFDPKCIKALEYIIEKTDAEIVISSSWKDNPNCSDALAILREIWQRRKLPGHVLDITPILTEQDYQRLYGISVPRKWKGYEIEQWLKKHPECDTYAIVDDQKLFLREQNKRFVKTTAKDGLTMRKAKRIIRIINQNTTCNFIDFLLKIIKQQALIL